MRGVGPQFSANQQPSLFKNPRLPPYISSYESNALPEKKRKAREEPGPLVSHDLAGPRQIKLSVALWQNVGPGHNYADRGDTDAAGRIAGGEGALGVHRA